MDEMIYKTPAPDFELGCFQMEAGKDICFVPSTAEIYYWQKVMLKQKMARKR